MVSLKTLLVIFVFVNLKRILVIHIIIEELFATYIVIGKWYTSSLAKVS